ncbi:hypothetical protein ACM66B_004138 [Microbotryomycetes sp. NB124-2]
MSHGTIYEQEKASIAMSYLEIPNLKLDRWRSQRRAEGIKTILLALLVPPNAQDTPMTLEEHLELGPYSATRMQDSNELDPPLKDCLSPKSIKCARLCLKAAGVKDDASIDGVRELEGGWISDHEPLKVKTVRNFTEMVALVATRKEVTTVSFTTNHEVVTTSTAA